MFNRSRALVGGAAAALAAISSGYANRIYGAENIKRAISQSRKGKYYGNTSRYRPHQGEREIARRVRQAERDAQRQYNRVDCGRTYYVNGERVRPERISRRGRVLA